MVCKRKILNKCFQSFQISDVVNKRGAYSIASFLGKRKIRNCPLHFSFFQFDKTLVCSRFLQILVMICIGGQGGPQCDNLRIFLLRFYMKSILVNVEFRKSLHIWLKFYKKNQNVFHTLFVKIDFT